MNPLFRASTIALTLALSFALAQSDIGGRWDGAIGPGVLDLEVSVTFTAAGDGWSGAIDIPAQGARDLPLRDIEVAGDGVRFVIADIPGDPTFEGSVEGACIIGTFSQGGQEFGFILERGAESAAAGPATEPAFLGVWDGVIGPGVVDVRAILTFEDDDGVLIGSIDIPSQGLAGYALEISELSGAEITFVLPGIPGVPTIEASLDGDALVGTALQGGQTFEVRFERLPDGQVPAGLARPQEPQPPFPYRQEEVVYSSGDITLAATLTLPDGPGPHPAVVMITGSGPQDRDEALAGHKPFLVIADRLTREGFAVLRSDDRGVGGSGGDLQQATYDELVDDVLAGVGLLKARSDIDGERIGLFGHSEGGYLGPLAADRSDDVAFVVMMAGPSVSGRDVLLLQNRLLFGLAGATPEQIEAQLSYIDAIADAFVLEDYAEVERLTRAEIETQLAALPEDQRPGPAEVEARASAQVAGLATPYFREIVIYDPTPVLNRLTVPVLGFYGNLDVQVPAAQNVGRLSGALRVAGNPDYRVEMFDGLNHLMQPARTGAVSEYGEIETTIAPEVLELVVTWLQERFLR